MLHRPTLRLLPPPQQFLFLLYSQCSELCENANKVANPLKLTVSLSLSLNLFLSISLDFIQIVVEFAVSIHCSVVSLPGLSPN